MTSIRWLCRDCSPGDDPYGGGRSYRCDECGSYEECTPWDCPEPHPRVAWDPPREKQPVMCLAWLATIGQIIDDHVYPVKDGCRDIVEMAGDYYTTRGSKQADRRYLLVVSVHSAGPALSDVTHICVWPLGGRAPSRAALSKAEAEIATLRGAL